MLKRVQNLEGGGLKSSQSMNAVSSKPLTAQSTATQLLTKRGSPNATTDNVPLSNSTGALVASIAADTSAASSPQRPVKDEADVRHDLRVP